MKRIFSGWPTLLRGAGFFIALILVATNSLAAELDSAAERFRDNGDGTVTDLVNNLTWQQCPSGQPWNGFECADGGGIFDANELAAYVESVSTAGFSDWRLPTPAELRSLVYCSSGSPTFWLAATEHDECGSMSGSPTLKRSFFTHNYYAVWTNELYLESNQGQMVDFRDGSNLVRYSGAGGEVRLVRDEAAKGRNFLVKLQGTGHARVIVDGGKQHCADTCHVASSRSGQLELKVETAVGTVFEGWSGACSGDQPSCLVNAGEVGDVVANVSLSMAERRYQFHSDGTAYDRQQQLVWSRCFLGETWRDGECLDSPKAHTYGTATAILNEQAHAQHKGWRLPTKTELSNRIYCEVDDKLGNPIANDCSSSGYSDFRDPVVFPTAWDTEIWTSTEGQLSNSHVVFDDYYGWTDYDSGQEAFATPVKNVPDDHQYTRFFIAGSGQGSITISSGDQCSDDCHRFLADGETVTLTASANSDSEFMGWSGACSGKGACQLEADKEKIVTAHFMMYPEQRYQNNLDGTVSDSSTGLTWRVCPLNYAMKKTDSGDACFYQGQSGASFEGLLAGQKFDYAGHSNWRLPTRDELNSLVMCTVGVWKNEADRCPFGGFDDKIHPAFYRPLRSYSSLGNVATSNKASNWSSDYKNYQTIDFNDGEVGSDEAEDMDTVILVRDTASGTTTLHVRVDEQGSGTVLHAPSGMQCETACSTHIDGNQNIELTAIAKQGYRFDGWRGSCAGQEMNCNLSANAISSEGIDIVADFEPLQGHERYQFINEQSVEDTETDLIWQRCPIGSRWNQSHCVNDADRMDAANADALVSELKLDGASNWRLPTVAELQTLIMCREAQSSRWPQEDEVCVDTPGSDYRIDVSTFGYLPTSDSSYVAKLNDGSGYRTLNFVSQQVRDSDRGLVRLVRTRHQEEVDDHTLSLTLDGSAESGSISVMPNELECVESCQLSFSDNDYVVLVASANEGYVFAGWGGACRGNQATCLVRMNQAQYVYASILPQETAQRFELKSDGTAIDHWTGLTWQRCAVGQQWTGSTCVGKPEHDNFLTVQGMANSVDGWRLPTQDELADLVYCASGKPEYWTKAEQACRDDTDELTLKRSLFPSMSKGGYTSPWSSNLNSATGKVSTIDFHNGITDTVRSSYSGAAWLVNGEPTSLTVHTEGDGGVGVIVEPVGAQCGLLCEYVVARDSVITLTVEEPANTEFSHWSGACSGSSSQCQVEMSSAKSVTAHYRWREFSVSAEASSGGSVFVDNSTVRFGENLSFSVAPEYGYQVSSVSACGATSRQGNTYTVRNVTERCSINVVFEPISYTVTATGSEGVELTPSSAQVLMGAAHEVSVALKDGYELTNIDGCEGSLTNDVYTVDAVESDCIVSATANKKQYEVTFDLGEPGKLTSGKLMQIVSHGEPAIAPEFDVERGYEFTGWTGSFRKITGDLSVQARYKQVPIVYYVTISSDGKGEVSPAGWQEIGDGEQLSVTLTPAEGWSIARYVGGSCPPGKWTDNIYTTAPASKDCALKFNFAKPSKGGGALLLIMAVEAQEKGRDD